MTARPTHHRHLTFWVLALALVLAPLLGRMHQVLHAPGIHAPAHAHDHADGPHALFGSHAAADCQLLDQMLLGGTLPSSPAIAWQAPPAEPPAPPAARHAPARRLPAFLARAPPAASA